MVEKLGEEDLINQDLSGDMDGEEMDLDEVQLDESQPEESNRQDLSLEDIDGCEMEPDEVQVDEYSDWRSEGSDPPPFEAESDHGLKEVLEMESQLTNPKLFLKKLWCCKRRTSEMKAGGLRKESKYP